MAGIYIHIPFCKQACHYCDFHFSTSLKYKNEMIAAICQEIARRKNELDHETIETIYFGGGTPSVLEISEISTIIEAVYHNFKVTEHPEITLEANPDDLTPSKIIALSKTPINRLSIGMQSLFDADLKMMNRAHNAAESRQSLETAIQYFNNISVDLIYGIPNMSLAQWQTTINYIIELNIPHISCYALTVEPKTALEKLIKTGKIAQTNDAQAHEHFLFLIDVLTAKGYEHYEMSNFCKPGYQSKNNSAYWLGKKYIGVGPSAHSYDGKNRSWNVANNILYLKKIQNNEPTQETEQLSINDRYNEYIMTGLRTTWGVNLEKVTAFFGAEYTAYLVKQAQVHLKNEQLALENNVLRTTRKGKFFGDGISSDLFKID